MGWRQLLSLALALVYLFWVWRGYRRYSRIRRLFCLIGSLGISILLACDYIKTLPSYAPQRTITGLATNRTTSSLFDHSHSDFILIEAKTERRTLFTTVIDGPWADQPVRATYVDDDRFMPSVVRIEILDAGQSPWQVEPGHAGWVGSTEAKRRPPLLASVLGLLFILAGTVAPSVKTPHSEYTGDGTSDVSAG
jgi:hypothetical protein